MTHPPAYRLTTLFKALALAAFTAALASPVAAQLAPQPAAAASQPAPAPSRAALRSRGGASGAGAQRASGWTDLSPDQQKALAPLAPAWSDISAAQKRKWIALAQNFPRMSAEEQATLTSRMTEWVALSPQQRAAARLNFAKARKLPAEEKKAKWEEYQALSAEEKERLAAGGTRPSGAALALKPVPEQKLANVPQPRNARQSAAAASAAASAAEAASPVSASRPRARRAASAPQAGASS